MSDRNQAILYSCGHEGTEGEFGRCADGHWLPDTPTIPERPFAATGTWNLDDEGRKTIAGHSARSFDSAKCQTLRVDRE